MNITQFNRQNLKELSNDIQTALQTVADKYGITVETGNGTFDSETFNKKIHFRITKPNTVVVNPTSSSTPNIYDRSLIGKSFRYQGSVYKITDLKPERPKYPVVGISVRGAKYRFPLEVLNNLI